MTTYSPADDQRLLAIRKTIIVAIASDDVLMERLVLKGGNALDIVYQLGERSSLDVDFSMSRGITEDEVDEFRDRLFRALRDRFDSFQPFGYVVFDDKFEARPRPRMGQASGLVLWGGYNATFKLIPRNVYRELGGQLGVVPDGSVLEAMRRQSQVTGSGSERVFVIEISKFEYTEGRVLQTVDDFDCYVYTPAMIAAEKLRAICQQLPAYTQRRNPAPRPRDFFDVHTIATKTDCDLAAPEHHDLVMNMFAAKEVPLSFLRDIGEESTRDFHAQQWESVQNAVRGATEPFDHYFRFTADTAVRILAALAAAGRYGVPSY